MGCDHRIELNRPRVSHIELVSGGSRCGRLPDVARRFERTRRRARARHISHSNRLNLRADRKNLVGQFFGLRIRSTMIFFFSRLYLLFVFPLVFSLNRVVFVFFSTVFLEFCVISKDQWSHFLIKRRCTDIEWACGLINPVGRYLKCGLDQGWIATGDGRHSGKMGTYNQRAKMIYGAVNHGYAHRAMHRMPHHLKSISHRHS
jgi:hypothetical protein